MIRSRFQNILIRGLQFHHAVTHIDLRANRGLNPNACRQVDPAVNSTPRSAQPGNGSPNRKRIQSTQPATAIRFHGPHTDGAPEPARFSHNPSIASLGNHHPFEPLQPSSGVQRGYGSHRGILKISTDATGDEHSGNHL